MKNINCKNRLKAFMEKIIPGEVYRAQELKKYSSSLSRDLKILVDDGQLKYLGKGLYYKPQKLGNLDLPPDQDSLLSKFLKSNKFIVRAIGDFNDLRLGTTQLFPETFVYNHRRDGVITLGNITYHFKRKDFPQKNFDEYLLVDMLNNLERVGEDRNFILQNLQRRWFSDLPLDQKIVLKHAQKYGKYWVKKFFAKLGNSNEAAA